MKAALFLIACSMTAGAAQASAMAGAERAAHTTSRSLDAFGQCFVSSQEQALRPWWFVPTEDGGTFSNLGSGNGQSVYFLRVQHSGAALQLSVESEDKTAAIDPVLSSIEDCI